MKKPAHKIFDLTPVIYLVPDAQVARKVHSLRQRIESAEKKLAFVNAQLVREFVALKIK